MKLKRLDSFKMSQSISRLIMQNGNDVSDVANSNGGACEVRICVRQELANTKMRFLAVLNT